MIRLAQLGLIVTLALLWEAASRMTGASTILPAPSTVIASLGPLYSDPALVQALLGTLFELATAFVLSVLVGGIIGYVLGRSLRIERIALPIVLLAYAIPQVTILPLFVLWLGLGAACKIGFGVAHGVFPVILSMVAGLRQAKPHYARWASSLGATPWQRFWRITLPQAVPALFTGMRLAMAMTLLGVLLAEIYVSSLGIGLYVRLFTDSMQGGKLFGLIFSLAALAVVLNAGVRALEERAGSFR